MDDDFSLFPKLNPLPPAENARDPKTGPGKEFRRKKKEKKKDLPGDKFASEGEDSAEENPDQKQVGKVLDITV
jgi:hypothetical protein